MLTPSHRIADFEPIAISPLRFSTRGSSEFVNAALGYTPKRQERYAVVALNEFGIELQKQLDRSLGDPVASDVMHNAKQIDIQQEELGTPHTRSVHCMRRTENELH